MRQDGERITLARARQLCHTDKAHGTPLIKLIAAFESIDYEANLREDVSWEELIELVEDDEQHVILVWWSVLNDGTPSEPEGHYSVVDECNIRNITVYDPQYARNGRMATYPRSFIESHWYDWDRIEGVYRDYCRAAIVVRKRGHQAG